MSIDINIGLRAEASGTNTITATYSPAPASLYNGLLLAFRAANSITSTTPTFNPNALGAKTIVKRNNAALTVGDIIANAVYWMEFNSTLDKWVLMNPSIAFGTNTDNVPEIGSTLGNSQIVETNGSGKLITAAKNTGYNKNTGKIAGTIAAGDDSRFVGVVINIGHALVNYADATTYYFGIMPGVAPATSSRARLSASSPITGTITALRINFNYTPGTNEATTIKIRNVTTATEISPTTTLDFSVAANGAGYYFSGLSLAVTAGDIIEMQLVAPTWATNPTTIVCGGFIYITAT